jgi:hypothetical protein
VCFDEHTLRALPERLGADRDDRHLDRVGETARAGQLPAQLF